MTEFLKISAFGLKYHVDKFNKIMERILYVK